MQTTFFIIITPRDLSIARYSLKKWLPRLNADRQLCVYFNGVERGSQGRVRELLRSKEQWIQFKDNLEAIEAQRDEIYSQIGQDYVTDTGIVALRQGMYENGSAIWTRELPLLTGDLIGIVDADFEILDDSFLDTAISSFQADPKLGYFSSDYSPRVKSFCTYSQRECELEERYHTWFCLYRKVALELESDFSYRERPHGNLVLKSDHSAELQRRLADQHHLYGACLAAEDRWKYIHYGAFAKNRSLGGLGLFLYRGLRIARHNGLRHLHGNLLLARAVMKLARMAYAGLGLQRYERERSRYPFQPIRGGQPRLPNGTPNLMATTRTNRRAPGLP